MIAFSTTVFDPDGSVTMRDSGKGDVSSISRRVSRTATLDGGVVLPDYGFSDGDRTLDIRCYATEQQYATIKRLVSTYPLLTVATKEGLFLGAVERLNRDGEILNMTFLVKERVA